MVRRQVRLDWAEYLCWVGGGPSLLLPMRRRGRGSPCLVVNVCVVVGPREKRLFAIADDGGGGIL